MAAVDRNGGVCYETFSLQHKSISAEKSNMHFDDPITCAKLKWRHTPTSQHQSSLYDGAKVERCQICMKGLLEWLRGVMCN
ncbi:unnamed protein product [Ceratitis capitata]|uniref:(Mediterranean fruit fly) hypothetical protein n=1 Tax=Ceratitis capitata TaxID=7213 RepID=A0A811VET3_CERCA|nr:unnamed protein product [Ceratitis capitata]